MGLPETGKSTFIGALWHSLMSSTKKSNANFSIEFQPNDREYLNRLEESWLSYDLVDRTKTTDNHDMNLTLINNSTSANYSIRFPDLSGELYQTQFESRKFTRQFHDLIEDVDSLVLFLNPSTIIKPRLISDVRPILNTHDQENDEKDSDGGNVSSELPDWSHKSCPTQVVLVDLLQAISQTAMKLDKISVVVSAWDTVIKVESQLAKEEIVNPTKWLEKHLPLLAQYLSTNYADRYKIFGVSAQGGDYSIDKKDLLSIQNPTERIIVSNGLVNSHNIMLPLEWLLDD